MVITVLSNQNNDARICCVVRREWVKATPEEKVRQELLHTMIEEWGYPSSLILVEKALLHLPGVNQAQRLPKRRMDIVCYAKNKQQELYPLLVVECKACQQTAGSSFLQKLAHQLLGYNYYIGAPFIGVKTADDFQVFDCKTSQKLSDSVSYQRLSAYLQ